MNKLLYLTFLILFCSISHAQPKLDSLKTNWENQELPDSFRLKAYKEYIWDKYLFNHPDSAFEFAQIMYETAIEKQLPYYQIKALNMQGISFMIQSDCENAIKYYSLSLNIAETTNDKRGMSDAFSNIATCYRNLGNYSAALQFDFKSLEIEKESNYKLGIAQSLNNIGIIYKMQGDYPQALEYYNQSLKIKEELGDKKGIANSLSNIGIIYRIQEEYKKSLEYYYKSLSIKEEIGHKSGLSKSYNNIGGTYFLLEDYDKAEKYYKKSQKIKEEVGDKSGVALVLSNLGVIYDKRGKHTEAMNYHLSGLKLREEVENKQGIAESMINIGESYFYRNAFKQSVSWCKKALIMSEDIGVLSEQQQACECIYRSYRSLNRGMHALEYFEKSMILNDSLKGEETNLKLQQMEFSNLLLQDSLRYADKEYQTKLLHHAELHKKDRIKNISLISGILVLLLAGGLWSRLNFIRKSREEIKKERDRSENLLLNILPADIAEELKANGKSAARDFDTVSILFTDFVKFTQFSETLNAQELVSEIHVYFEAFDHICDKFKIEKIKTIGDSYMAAGGIPVPFEDSVKNTVLAGLEMAEFILIRKNKLKTEGKASFDMRVGINTGAVAAGIVGVKKFQYDIWGDTVNTASRMESNGKIGKVNISQSTYNVIKDDPLFDFEPRGRIEVKGKGEIEMYFVKKSK